MQQTLRPSGRTRAALLSSFVFLGAACGSVHAADTTTWKKIASEWEPFTLSSQKLVRYGTGTRWTTKLVSGAAMCTNTFFGTDPARGYTKECDIVVEPTTTSPTAGTATLQWSASTTTGAQYRVYYGTASRAYAQAPGSGLVASTTSKTVSGLQSGRLYYFAVTAIDGNGNESVYSNEVSKIAP